MKVGGRPLLSSPSRACIPCHIRKFSEGCLSRCIDFLLHLLGPVSVSHEFLAGGFGASTRSSGRHDLLSVLIN